MPTWAEVESFITKVGLPTALVLGGLGVIVWYGVRPLSENFLGKEGWIAKWFSESITSSAAMREAIAKLTELFAGLQSSQNEIKATQAHHTRSFETLSDEVASLRRGGHGGDHNCRVPKAS